MRKGWTEISINDLDEGSIWKLADGVTITGGPEGRRGGDLVKVLATDVLVNGVEVQWLLDGEIEDFTIDKEFSWYFVPQNFK